MKIKTLDLKILFVITLLILLIAVLKAYFGVRFNFSESMPRGIYILDPTNEIKKGSIISFCPKGIERLYHSTNIESNDCDDHIVPFLKQVVAIPNDFINLTDEGIFVNNTLLLNTQRIKYDQRGNLIPAITFKEHYQLTPDEYLVIGLDHLSWDSRYYGTIKKSQIIEILKEGYIW